MKRKILVVLLLTICIGLTACSKKISEEEIQNMLEVNNDERTFVVNKITYATEKVTVNGIDMLVKDNSVTLGDYISKSDSEKYKQITGYYDQPAATYNIYVLSENNSGKKTIWKLQKDSMNTFDSVGWVNMNISNPTDLILIDCEETVKELGQTPTRYQVYALVNNELQLLS